VTGSVDWGRYVGLPHLDHGRTREGVDCWGLLRLVYAEEFGIDLPDYLSRCPGLTERAELSALIGAERDAGGWQDVDRIAPGDALLFRIGPYATHIAVAISPLRMLHVAAGSRSVIERIASPQWRRRLVGIYRHGGPVSPVRVVETRGLLPEVAGRRRFDLAPSGTIAEIVAEMMPGASDAALDRVRVTMINGDSWAVVPRRWWPHVRPHGGTVVTVRIVPGLGTLAINIALFLSANTALPALAINALAIGAAVAVGALGVAALNALIRPPELPDGPPDPEQSYSLRGWRNQAIPGEPVPCPMGQIRVAPVYAMQPFQEVVGDEQYIRALFCFGIGRLDISELKIGETPIEEFDYVEYELREGAPGDDPVTLTPIQVLEQPENIELLYTYPLDSAGNPDIGAGLEESPITRTLASNSVRAGVVLSFPAGLFRLEDDGRIKTWGISVRIRQRPVGGSWTTVETLTYYGQQTGGFFRQYTWDLGARGDYEIEVTRVSSSTTDPKYSDTCYLTAIQSYRPEYPIATSEPLALCAIKIRAGHQLSGTLDSLNAVVTRYAPDHANGAWPDQQTRNPAALYVLALQGAGTPFPVPDASIDWDTLADWHEFCEIRGLTYDRDQRAFHSLLSRLRDIAGAGRAAPWHDGARWSVLIDRPAEAEVDHITPRNSRNFTGSRTYLDAPDAVRVRFRDRDNGYADSEIVVPWPGNPGPYDVVEQWDIPGKTDGREIQREVYRQMQVVIQRRDRWTVEQDGALRVATRGDWVRLSHYVLSDTQYSGRVLSSNGALVVLDEAVTMEAGGSYAIRFLDFDGADTVGQSVLSAVQTVPGETRTLRVTGSAVPAAGALVQFGPAGEEAERALVLAVEPGQDFAATLTLTNAAPQIDTLTDAFIPSDWNPIVGEIVDVGVDPGAPVFAGIRTTGAEGEYGTDARSLLVSVSAAATEAALISGFELDHRLQGAGSWTTVAATGAPVQVELSYDTGDVVELRARAEDFDGDFGDYTSTETFTVGSDAAALAATPNLATLSVTAGLGVANVTLSHSDANTTRIQIFRTADGAGLDTDTDTVGAPVSVLSGQTVGFVDGDSTRVDLLAASWTAGSGWGGTTLPSTATPGAASALEQAVSLTNGETYRGQITISGRTAGSVTVEMTGGAPEVSSSAITDNGQTLFSLDADGGNTTFAVTKTSDFDGTVESVTLFLETAASAPQGVYDYRFAALNIDDIGSAVSGAITVTII
jgi:hypothetical protein